VESNFGRALTIGVEEELQLIDPETFALAPGVERLLGPDGLKTELFSCLIETNTPVCESAEEARDELVRLRREVREDAAGEGLAVAGAGSHPFSRADEQEIVPKPRYLRMLAELGPKLRRQLVCGLHVHIGMESFDACLRTLAAVVPWLPDVLALSLNSPYIQGAETGELSSRAARLAELPRGAQPPVFASAEEWETYIEATGEDYTRSWWDARPHPRLGTIEVRIPDQPTEVDRSAALAALIQALCAAAPPPADGTRDSYLGRRAAAAARGEARTTELLALVEPAARELGTWDLVEELRRPPEALRQLETGRRDGLEAVVAELVAGTAA
jgi:carboxylate-amine ligase